jgi:carbonic anhydrase/acetyltransferase-like protein (isoleucine patch superfamily)
VFVTDIRGEEVNLGCASNVPVSGDAMFRVSLGLAGGVVGVGAVVEVGTRVAVGAGAIVAAGAVVGAGKGVLVGCGVAVADAPQAKTNIKSRVTKVSRIARGLPGQR